MHKLGAKELWKLYSMYTRGSLLDFHKGRMTIVSHVEFYDTLKKTTVTATVVKVLSSLCPGPRLTAGFYRVFRFTVSRNLLKHLNSDGTDRISARLNDSETPAPSSTNDETGS